MRSPGPEFEASELPEDELVKLVKNGGVDVNWLLKHGLWDGREVVRRNSAGAIAAKGELPDGKGNLLAIAGKDTDPRVRELAVTALGRVNTPPSVAVPAILHGLCDSKEPVSAAAIESLTAWLKREDQEALQLLVNALGDPRPLVRATASELLVQAGFWATPTLVAALEDAGPAQLDGLRTTIAQLSTTAAQALITGLRNPGIREECLSHLTRLPELDKQTEEALNTLVAGDEADLASAAQKVLDDVRRAQTKPRPVPFVPPTPAFVQQILDEETLDAIAAEAQLGMMLTALRDSRPVVRGNAAAILARMGASGEGEAGDEARDSMVATLLPLARDGEAEVRVQVTAGLARLDRPEVAPALLIAASDEDRSVAQAAREAMTRVSDALVQPLMEALESKQPSTAHAAVLDAVTARGAKAVAGLKAALGSPKALTREMAAEALERLGPAGQKAAPALIAALGDSLEGVRAKAAAALGASGNQDKKVRAALSEATQDTVARVRREASIALARLDGKHVGPKPPREAAPIPIPGFDEKLLGDKAMAPAKEVGAEAFLALLGDGRSVVRANAARAIGVIGAAAAGSAQKLLPGLRDGDVTVREAVVEALGRLGDRAVPASGPGLVDALADDDKRVREAAAAAMKSLERAALPHLVAALGTNARRMALELVAAHGKAAVPLLVEAMESSRPEQRAGAAEALGLLGAETVGKAREALEALKSDQDKAVKAAAKQALDTLDGVVPPPTALEPVPLPHASFEDRLLEAEALAPGIGETAPEALQRMLRDGRPIVRANAATALTLLPEHGLTSAALLAPVLKDADVRVRIAAAKALGALGAGVAKVSGPVLVHGLADPEPAVNKAVVEALVSLGAPAGEALAPTLEGVLSAELAYPVFGALGPAGIGALKQALGDDTPTTRQHALLAVRHLDREVAQAVREDVLVRCKDEERAVRMAAKQTLDQIDGKGPPPKVLEPVALPHPEFDQKLLDAEAIAPGMDKVDPESAQRLLRDGRSVVRANGATALTLLPEHALTSAALMEPLLKDGDPGVRKAAARAMAALGPKVKTITVPALVRALTDSDQDVREAVVAAIVSLGAEAAPLLAEGLADDLAGEATFPVFVGLGAVGIPTLAKACVDENTSLRITAMKALRELDRKIAEKARGAVLDCAKHEDRMVRREARSTLDFMDGKGPPPKVLAPLVLPHPDFATKKLAAEAIAPGMENVQPESAQRMLRDGRAMVRANGATALTLLPEHALTSAALMLPLLKDGDPVVRASAAAALGALGPSVAPVSAPGLAGALGDSDADVAAALVGALVALGPAAKDALIEQLDGPDRARAAFAVFRAMGEGSVPILAAAMVDEQPMIRVHALEAARELPRAIAEKMREAALDCAKHDLRQVRMEARKTIDHMDGIGPPPKVLEPLALPHPDFADKLLDSEVIAPGMENVEPESAQRMLRDGRAMVRANGATALTLMPEHALTSAALMVPLLKDGDATVRKSAAAALGVLGPSVANVTAEPLVAALGDADADVEAALVGALVALGDKAKDALLAQLDAADTAKGATGVFKGMAAAGLPILRAALTDEQPLVRIHGMRIVRELPMDLAGKLREAALDCAKHDEREVRLEARKTIDFMDGKGPPPKVLAPLVLPHDDFATKLLDAGAIAPGMENVQPESAQRMLRDGRAMVRANGATALTLMPEHALTSAALMVPLLKDGDATVRKSAAAALGALGPGVATVSAEPLVAALGDGDAEVREALVGALVALGAAAKDALIAQLDVADTATGAVGVFQGMGEAGLPILAAALGDENPLVRIHGMRIVRELPMDLAGKLREEALVCAKHDERGVRLEARKTIDYMDGIGPPPKVLEPVALPHDDFATKLLELDAIKPGMANVQPESAQRMLRDGRPFVRANGATALTLMPEHALTSAALMVPLLKDGEAAVRKSAAAALGALGPGVANVSAEPLAAALSDSDLEVQAAVVGALVALIGSKHTEEALISRLDADKTAAGVARVCKEAGEAGLKVLALGMADESTEVRVGALKATRELAMAVAAPLREPALGCAKHEARAVRMEARKTIDFMDGKGPPPKVLEPVALPHEDFATKLLDLEAIKPGMANVQPESAQRMLRDGRPFVRANGALALTLMPEHALTSAALMVPLLKDGEAVVRRAAAAALGALGPSVVTVTAAPLVRALVDPDLEVHTAAVGSLVTLGGGTAPPPRPEPEVDAKAEDKEDAKAEDKEDAKAEAKAEAAEDGGEEAAAEPEAPEEEAPKEEAPKEEAKAEAPADGEKEEAEAPAAPAAEGGVPAALVAALLDGLSAEPLRAMVAIVCREMGAGGVEVLAAALAHEENEIRVGGLKAVLELPMAVAAKLRDPALACAKHDARSVRAEARKAIDHMDGKGPPPKVLEPLVLPHPDFATARLELEAIAPGMENVQPESAQRMLRDGRPFVRANGATALTLMPEHGLTSAALMVPLLKDGNPIVRACAAAALGKLGGGFAIVSARPLVLALGDSDSEAAGAIVQALVALGGAAKEALLEEMDAADVAIAAHPVFRGMGAGAVPILAEALASEAVLVRVHALNAVRELPREIAGKLKEPTLACAKHEEGAVRRAARKALDHIEGIAPPPKALEPLALPHPDFATKLVDSGVLKGAIEGVAPESVQRMLRDGRPFVRANGAIALTHLPEHALTSAALMMPLLKDGDANVRRAAAEALGELGPKVATISAPGLVATLRDGEPEVRHATTEALVELGKAADDILVEPLVDALAEGHGDATVPVFVGLADAGMPVLKAALTHDKDAVRVEALRALFALDKEIGAPARPDVLENCRHASRRVRMQAKQTLDHLDGKGPPPKVLEPLALPHADFATKLLDADAIKPGMDNVEPESAQRMLRDGRALVRANGATALTLMPEHALTSAALMQPLLKDEAPEVRRSVAAALGALGGGVANVSAPGLVQALTDPVAEVHEAVVAALVALGEAAGFALVEPLEAPLSAEVAFKVFEGLGEVGIPTLVEALTHESATVRINALRALEVLEPAISKAAREAVLQACKDEGTRVRMQAKQTLDRIDGRAPPPKVLEPAVLPVEGFDSQLMPAEAIAAGMDNVEPESAQRLLRDGRPFVRANGATALTLLPEHALTSAALMLPLLKDGDANVRRATAAALGVLGPKVATVSAPGLVGALNDRAPDVREAVVDALVALGEAAGEALLEPLESALGAESAAPVFAKLGKDGLAALKTAMEHDLPAVRTHALVTLREVELEVAKGIRESVLAACKDDQVGVRREAKVTLDWLDGRAAPPKVLEPAALPVEGFDKALLEASAIEPGLADIEPESVQRLLRDGRHLVRANGATALTLMPKHALTSAALMVPLLKDGAREVRLSVARAMGALGPDVATVSAPALVGALGDRDGEVKAAVVEALVSLGEAGAFALVEPLDSDVTAETVFPVFAGLAGEGLKTLSGALTDGRTSVRANAARVVRHLGEEVGKPIRADVLEACRDDERAVRVEAKRALDTLDGRGEPPKVLEPLALPHPEFDKALLDDETIKPLVTNVEPESVQRMLRDGRPFVRANGATALSMMPEVALTSAALMVPLLRDEHPDVRKQIARALGAMDPSYAAITAPGLVAALGDREERVHEAVVEAVVALGVSAGPWLIEHLESGLTTPHAFEVFERLGETGVPVLVEALSHDLPAVREHAAEAVGRLGQDKGAAAREAVLAACKDDERRVRMAAKAALDVLDGREPPPKTLAVVELPSAEFETEVLEAKALAAATKDVDTESLQRLLRDGRPLVRANAAGALGLIPEHGLTSGALLVPVIRDSDARTRKAAAEAIAALGEKAGRAPAGALVLGLADEDAGVRDAAARALVALGAHAADALTEALQSDLSAESVFPVFAEMGEPAVPILRDALVSERVSVRVNAARAVKAMGPEKAAPLREPVLQQCKDKEREVRFAAKRALDMIDGRPEPPKALEPTQLPHPGFDKDLLTSEDLASVVDGVDPESMQRLLRDGRARVRANAATALGLMPDIALTSAALMAAAVRDGNVEVRRSIAEALGALGEGVAMVSAPGLAIALLDKDPGVAQAAHASLVALGEPGSAALIPLLGGPLTAKSAIPVFADLGKKGHKTLEEALQDNDPSIRFHACEAVAALGEKGGAPLKDAVLAVSTDPDKHVRSGAMAAMDVLLGREPAPLVLEPIEAPVEGFETELLDAKKLAKPVAKLDAATMARLLADGRAVVRANAATAASTRDDLAEALAGYVGHLVRDESPDVRLAAAVALTGWGDKASVAAPALVRALADAIAGVHEAARDALLGMGEAAARATANALDTDDIGRLMEVIEGLGKTAVPSLVESVQQHISPTVRAHAAHALAALGPDVAKSARDVLEEAAAGDWDKTVRIQARLAVDVIDGKEPPPRVLDAVELPIEGFDSELLSVEALGKAAKKLDGDLVERLTLDGRATVRANAAASLGVLGEAERAARLVGLTRDADAAVRKAAAVAIGALGPDAAAVGAAALVRMLEDTDAEVIKAARAALDMLGPAADEALAAALDSYLSENTVLPVLVAHGQSAVEPLVSALQHASPLVRISALKALRMLGPEVAGGAREAIEAALEDPEMSVRVAAQKTRDVFDGIEPPPTVLEEKELPEGFDKEALDAKAAGKAAGSVDADRLREMLRDGRDTVRENAARAIGGLAKKAAAEMAAELPLSLKDPSLAVRIAAAESLAATTWDADVAVPALVRAVQAGPDAVGEACLATLDAYKKATAGPVLSMIGERPDLVLGAVATVMARDPKSYVKELAKQMIEAESPIARENAIDLLGALGPDAQAAEKALADNIDHTDVVVRAKVIRALGRVGKPTDELKKMLTTLKRVDRRPSVVMAVTDALRSLRQQEMKK